MYTYHPHHSRRQHARTFAIRVVGNFLIVFSLYMLSWVFLKPAVEEAKYAYNQLRGKTYIVSEDASALPASETKPQSGLLSQILAGKTVEPLVPKDPQFSILIPKLGANERVLPNVNSADENDYLPALQKGVAHAAGTAFPGEGGHVYLFAHSTNTFSNVSRYNAVFYLLYKLENGDEINVYYRGVRHRYAVIGKQVVDPSEVTYLTRKTTAEFLTLQTCWPPGTTSQRMLIFAEPLIR